MTARGRYPFAGEWGPLADRLYGWIVDHDDGLEVLTRIGGYIDSLRDTSSTFKLVDAIDSNSPRHRHRMAALIHGAWQVPYRLRGEAYEHRYVNPSSPHRSYYTDCAAVCECGALRVRPGFQSMDDKEDKHADGCKPHWRHAVDHHIWARRERAVSECAWLGWRAGDAADRLSVDANNVRDTVETLGYDWQATRGMGMRERAEVWTWLVENGHTQREVAEAFGLDRSTLADHINGRIDLMWRRPDDGLEVL